MKVCFCGHDVTWHAHINGVGRCTHRRCKCEQFSDVVDDGESVHVPRRPKPARRSRLAELEERVAKLERSIQ